MTFLDEIKDAIELLKRKLGVSWLKLLDQIPDQDRIDSYRYDEVLKDYVLLQSMKEPEVPILDENRNLKVVTPNYVITSGVVSKSDPVGVYDSYVNLDFLADSLTIVLYNISGEEGDFELQINYYIDVIEDEPVVKTFYTDSTIEIGANTIDQEDIKPYSNFKITFIKSSADEEVYYKIIFSKQKKTKISDLVYSSSWDTIDKVGASKNTLYDKLTSLGEADITLVQALAYVNAQGLSLANTKVIVSQDGDLTFLFGRCALGSPISDYAIFAHRDCLNATDYAFAQTATGYTLINAKLGAIIQWRINNINKMYLNTSQLYLYVNLNMNFHDISNIKTLKQYSTGTLYNYWYVGQGTGNARTWRLIVDDSPTFWGLYDETLGTYVFKAIGNDGDFWLNRVLDMVTHKIKNVVDPTEDQDVATKKFVDDHNWEESDITDLDKLTEAEILALTWNEDDITDLDKYTQAQVDSLVGFPIGSIIMFHGEFTNNVTKIGWYICDGENGTIDLIDQFIRGARASGGTGGSDDAVIVSHKHTFPYYSDPGGGADNIVVEGITGAVQYKDTSTTGVSGVGKNVPAHTELIFIQRIS